jgi:hypothetical protein
MSVSVQTGFVSMRKLEYLLGSSRRGLFDLAERAAGFYHPFDLKRPRKRWRHIDNPTGALKRVQTRIQRRVLRELPLPPTILGGVVGKSIRHNAERHVGADVLVTLDIADCFPTISYRRVFATLRREGFSDEISHLLTKLTTHEWALPQGAATSTTLANLCLRPLHDDLLGLARDRGLELTFWVDDIALSGPQAECAIEAAVGVVHRHGFRIRSRKKKVMRAGRRQELTGTCTNRKVSAGRERIQTIREEIVTLADSPRPLHCDLQRVRGMIANVHNLCRRQGAVLSAFADRMLPRCGTAGTRARSDQVRPCPGRRQHRND